MLTSANFKWQVLVTFFAEELLGESWAPRSADMRVGTGSALGSDGNQKVTIGNLMN